MNRPEGFKTFTTAGVREASAFCGLGIFRHRKSLLLFVGLMLGALLNMYVKEGFERLDFFQSTDLYKFQLSGQRLSAGESMYWAAPAEQAVESNCRKDGQLEAGGASDKSARAGEPSLCLHPNLNPPVFGFIALALAALPPSAAWWIWGVASGLASLIALSLIAGTLTTKSPDLVLMTALAWVAFLFYYPSFTAYSLGQVTFFLFLPLVAGWLALRNGQDFVAGAWIGLAASLKPFFGLFLLLFFAGRYWRAVAGFVLVGLVALMGGAWLAGVKSYFQYASILSDVTWLSASWNGSIAGFLDRIARAAGDTSALRVDWLWSSMKITLVAAVLWISLGAVFKARRLGRALQSDILFGIAVPAMLLMSPLGWLYYYPFLFLTFYAIVVCSTRLEHAVRYKLLIGVAVALTAIPTPLLPGYTLSSPQEWFWDAGRYTYALLISFGLIAFIAMRTAMPELKGQEAS